MANLGICPQCNKSLFPERTHPLCAVAIAPDHEPRYYHVQCLRMMELKPSKYAFIHKLTGTILTKQQAFPQPVKRPAEFICYVNEARHIPDDLVKKLSKKMPPVEIITTNGDTDWEEFFNENV